jgi:serine protease
MTFVKGTGRMKNPENPTLQENEFLRRIVVKFVDDFELPYEDGAEEYLPDDLREQWDELAQAFPGITLRRLFRSITPERILELVRRAVQTDPTYKPPNFLTFFAIDTPQNSDPSELVEALAKWEVIQYVYLESPLAPLPAVPPTGLNPEMILQAYLDPPHLNVATGQLDVTHLSGHIGGIDARFAWNFGSAASAGSGVTFIDIEKAWVLNHEDLVDPSMLPSLVEIIDHLPGPSATTIEHCDEGPLSICRAHGTSVLGILVAQDNPVGCVGIAYEAAAKVISIWEPPPSAGADPSKNIPDAILAAASNLTFGDVMLLELQINPSGTLLPVELEPAIFEKIRLSTALGISVIEAAANGGQPLDTTGIDDKDSGAVHG